MRPARPFLGQASRRATAALALALAFTLGLTGCASTPKPTLVSVHVQAAASTNPDGRKRPSPLVLRVYELKSAALFDAADFVSLFEREPATLGAELAAREEFVLRPGESKQWDKPVAPGTQFIGVMAAFRDIEHARWKSLVALQPGARNVVTIQAVDIAVTAKAGKP